MVAGLSPLAGTFTDKTDVFGKFFAALGERSGGSLSIEIETVVVNDQTVVVLSHHTAAHGGAHNSTCMRSTCTPSVAVGSPKPAA
jgi:hypothetical protein